LRGHGTEFVWNLAPVTPTFDLPYVAMVWDLQHRLQPFFPEVSAESEWETREQMFRVLLQRATYVVTGNSAGRQEIEQFYQVPRERIRLLPHPTPRFALDARVSDASALRKWGLEPGYLFYPAQFWPHKNHTGLLHAVRRLRDQHQLAPPIVLVGSDKSNRQHVERVATDLGIANQLRILGFVDRADLASLYRHAGALVYVSYFGPENLPPLEAMALECPVIASRVSGSQEQFGDAALLVDPRDPGDIAATIARLVSNPALRTELVERGRIRARQFTSDDFVRGAFEMLDEFAAVRGCWGERAA
jgi:glycosyltransferase involved in cell wall biosynthesis